MVINDCEEERSRRVQQLQKRKHLQELNSKVPLNSLKSSISFPTSTKNGLDAAKSDNDAEHDTLTLHMLLVLQRQSLLNLLYSQVYYAK